MRFSLVFTGKTKSKYLREGIEDFQGRLSRFVQVELVVVKDHGRKNLGGRAIRQREGVALLEASRNAALRIALDPRGQQPDSPELARMISGWQEANIRSVAFLLGGHLGLAGQVRDQADLVLSLSRLTFTHEMSRLILLEQLYRAWTIKLGQHYHK